MGQKRQYDRIVGELPLIVHLQNIGVSEAVIDSGLTRADFKFLTIAHLYTIKRGFVLMKDFEVALRADCQTGRDISMKRLISLEYIDKISGRKWFGIGCKYATTGKAVYLIRKYTDIMRRLLKEADNLGMEEPRKKYTKKVKKNENSAENI